MALGDYTVVYGQVMTGDIDICVCPIASSYGVNADILSLPYLATDFDEFKSTSSRFLCVWDVVSEVNDSNGTVLMGIFNTGFMGIGSLRPRYRRRILQLLQMEVFLKTSYSAFPEPTFCAFNSRHGLSDDNHSLFRSLCGTTGGCC